MRRALPPGRTSVPVGWSHDLHVVGEQGGERVGVAGGDRGVEASRRSRSRRSLARGGAPVRDRRRAARATRPSARRSGRAPRRRGRRRTARCASRGHRLRRPGAGGTCRSKAPPLARSVPEMRPAHEERVGPQAEDVVDAHGERRRRARAGSGVPRRTASAPRADPIPEGPVVDELDGGRERRGVAIGVERSHDRRDRARRRRGAGARGAVGEELGVALVQAARRRRPGGRRRRPRSAGVAPARRPRSDD